MRLSFLREQLVRSSEQLVLVDTKKGFLGPDEQTAQADKYAVMENGCTWECLHAVSATYGLALIVQPTLSVG